MSGVRRDAWQFLKIIYKKRSRGWKSSFQSCFVVVVVYHTGSGKKISMCRSLPAQPISTRNKQSSEKAHKPLRNLYIFSKMCTLCLVIIKSCWLDYQINKPLTCSHSRICVSCSVHVITMYYVRKGSWAFYFGRWLVHGLRPGPSNNLSFRKTYKPKECQM